MGYYPPSLIPTPDTTPTIEELLFSTWVWTSMSGAGGSQGVFVAPFPLRILSASLLMWGGSTIATSDTDYWTVTLRRGQTNVVASKTTKVTGGEAVTARTDWNWDAVTFDTTYRDFAKGDVLAIYALPTGTPASGFGSSLLTVRYQPL